MLLPLFPSLSHTFTSLNPHDAHPSLQSIPLRISGLPVNHCLSNPFPYIWTILYPYPHTLHFTHSFFSFAILTLVCIPPGSSSIQSIPLHISGLPENHSLSNPFPYILDHALPISTHSYLLTLLITHSIFSHSTVVALLLPLSFAILTLVCSTYTVFIHPVHSSSYIWTPLKSVFVQSFSLYFGPCYSFSLPYLH